MSESYEDRELKMEKNRLEALTDGIFAFAMTLLVTSLILPRSAVVSDTAAQALVSLLPDFYHYIIAFFVLAAFWMSHHIQFSNLRYIDKPFLFLNIIGLFFVTLIAFTTSFIGDYDNDITATVTFEASLLILGVIIAIQWAYATWNRRLVPPDFPEHRIRYGIVRNLVVPSVSFAAIVLALLGFHNTTMMYMLLPPVSYAVDRWVKRQAL
ncbi:MULTISPECIES: TMEM175 family protein [unclassified Methanoregula]|uniref:TMEM175 family protein n=1 Tax=unclassified Methanoregula TaxID=2649730 RepID=UPI0009D4834F|nr:MULTISPECIES: TMEM175 family protein [unclassified Methanoregula]OPX62835.1 MAG: hypothetical protein A4E33_01964 [Methanoregula sp. PtaB.Bin085]OPY35272.1 MAG: hypothetical protein A4E34_00800 [Methanoregula sp. PtaU1.Bin006]